MTRRLRASDMFQLGLVAEPRPSADGRYVAYVRGCLDREADAVVEETMVTDLGTGAEWRPGPGGLRTARPPRAPGHGTAPPKGRCSPWPGGRPGRSSCTSPRVFRTRPTSTSGCSAGRPAAPFRSSWPAAWTAAWAARCGRTTGGARDQGCRP